MKEQGKRLINSPHTSSLKIVLAHGADVPMDSFFIKRIARGLADNGFSVVRFEFHYMQGIRQTGKRRR
jgi:predicted alpha/beta-hydrolase family hydrolase